MARFQFRLQRVLDARESEERQRQRDLAVALKKLEEEEDKLTRLKQESTEQQTAQRSIARSGGAAGDMLSLSRWLRQLRGRIIRQSELVTAAVDEVEKRRLRLLEITRDKKVLEKLKEHKLEEFRYQEAGIVQKNLDDIGSRLRNRTELSPDS